MPAPKHSKSKATAAAPPRTKGGRTTEEPSQPPNWPPFKPLVPPSDLSLTSLVPDHIVLIRNFWTSTLCSRYVTFLRTLPLVTTPGVPKKGDALRVNDRFMIMDPAFANRLWIETGLRDLVCGSGGDEGEESMTEKERHDLWGGEVVGLNPEIRIYRYSKGQYFDQHFDESNVLTLPTSPRPTPAKTTWTLLLYLTSAAEGCKGGETVFYPENFTGRKSPLTEPLAVSLETGMVLLHRHGNQCMLHEGREVVEGEKWIIRSDLCVKR